MGEILYFVPGEPHTPDSLLPGHFHPVPSAVVRACLEAYTRPGGLVMDPFCEGPAVLRQAVHAGRRAVGSSFNPLAARVIRLALLPPARRHLDAAVTRLGDAPRMGMPFREHIEHLYAVRCPHCGRTTPADAFAWDRDSAAILRLHWQCQHCG